MQSCTRVPSYMIATRFLRGFPPICRARPEAYSPTAILLLRKQRTGLKSPTGLSYPDKLPANAADTLEVCIPALGERQYRLRALESSAAALEHSLRKIEKAPFSHLTRCLRDGYYVRVAAFLTGIALLVWLVL